MYAIKKSSCISSAFTNKQIEDLAQSYIKLEVEQKCFFSITKENDTIKVQTLAQFLRQTECHLAINDVYFVFQDPSNGINPGWGLRIFLAALLDYCPQLSGSNINVIGLRCNISGGVENSCIFSVKIPVVS